jgi:hypothetical protein
MHVGMQPNSLVIRDSTTSRITGPNVTIRNNWLAFKDCTGKQDFDVKSASVFKAARIYPYSLKDPSDFPITIPPFVEPLADLGSARLAQSRVVA